MGDQVSSKPSALTRTLSSTRTLPLNEEHAGQATPIKTQGAVLFFPLIFLGFFFGSVRVGLNQTRHSEGQVVVVVGFAGTDDEYYYHRVIGLSVFGSRNWQESGKGPQIANGAAYCVPDLTSHTPPPLESIAGAARSVGLPSPHKPVRGRIRCGWRTGGVSVSQICCAPFPCIGQPCILQTESQNLSRSKFTLRPTLDHVPRYLSPNYVDPLPNRSCN